jgi:hypothetical protein
MSARPVISGGCQRYHSERPEPTTGLTDRAAEKHARVATDLDTVVRMIISPPEPLCEESTAYTATPSVLPLLVGSWPALTAVPEE